MSVHNRLCVATNEGFLYECKCEELVRPRTGLDRYPGSRSWDSDGTPKPRRHSVKYTLIAAALVTTAAVLAVPAPAVADQSAPDAPCKSVPSAANHCDWNGKNDVTGKHPQSDAHANPNSDCNARVCEPAPSPSPSPTSSPSPSPSPSPTATPTPEPTSTPTGEPTPESAPAPAAVEPVAEAPVSVTAAAPATVAQPKPATVKVPQAATLPAAVPAGEKSDESNVPAAVLMLALAGAAASAIRLGLSR